MNLNPWSMLFHAINALLLVIAYRFWMYKPVRKFLDARADKIKAEREEIERDRAAVQKEAAEVKAELDSARIQATKTLRESHARFDMEAAEKLSRAQSEAESVINQAKRRADDMIERSQEEIREEAVDLAILIAEKVLVREVSKADNEKIIDKFLAETTRP